MRLLLLFLALLLPVPDTPAQNNISDFSIRHFTSENGLPQNTVKAIARDEYGFIWLATEGGLVRFDGKRFRLYNKSNTDITSSRMYEIRQSPDGRRLVAISDSQELLLIEHGGAKKYVQDAVDFFLGANSKLKLRGSFWFQKSRSVDSLFLPLDEHASVIITLQQGLTWYCDAMPRQHTAYPRLKNFSSFFIIGHNLYRTSSHLSAGCIERITPEGIHEAHIAGDFRKRSGQEPPSHCFVETNDAASQVFLYAGRDLYLLHPLPNGDLDTRLLLSGFDLDKDEIRCAFHDSLHNHLFLGSTTNGLFVLDQKVFHAASYPGQREADVNVIYDHIPYNDSSVLTANGMVLGSNPTTRPTYKPLLTRTQEEKYIIFQSRDKDIWTCGPNRLYRFNPTATAIKGRWDCPYPSSLIQGKDGRLWIGTVYGGLYIMDPVQEHARPELFLKAQTQVMGMEWENEDTLWVCTRQHLLRVKTSSGQTDTLTALTGKVPRTLYIPRPGEVWICTYENGLYLWYQQRLTHFPISNYPYLNTAHKILEDDQGFFWISTNHGLYQVRRSDLLKYAGGGGEEPYYFYYGKEAGLLSNEFNGGSQNVGEKLHNGFFSFGSLNGVVFFNPHEIHPELPDGAIIIDKLEVDGREMPVNDAPVAVNRNFRVLSITPASAYLGDPVNLRYEYRMDDRSGWQNVRNGTIEFSALNPGTHQLYIRKKAGFGNSNHRDYRLALYVPPAWWETGWFYLSVFIALVLLVVLVIHMRVRYWKRRSRTLETAVHNRTQDLQSIIHDLERSEVQLGEQLKFQRMLNRNIAHDINTPLKYLTILTGDMATQISQNKMPSAGTVHSVHQTASQLYQIVRNLNQYMRERLAHTSTSSTKFSLYDVLQQQTELFGIVAQRQGTLFRNHVAPSLYLNQNKALIGIALHNLIDNAVKHTEKGSITFHARKNSNGQTILSVSDTGTGLEPELLQAYNSYFALPRADASRHYIGFGFLIVKEISLALKLEVIIESTKGQGTSFHIGIPDSQAEVPEEDMYLPSKRIVVDQGD